MYPMPDSFQTFLSPVQENLLCGLCYLLFKTKGVGTLKPHLERNKAKLCFCPYILHQLIKKFVLVVRSEVKILQHLKHTENPGFLEDSEA